MRGILLATITLVVVCRPSASVADPISYFESITTSGTLNGSAFTGRLVTLRFDANTTNVVATSTGDAVTISGATVTVAGLGTDTLTDAFKVGVDHYSTFSDFTASDLAIASDILDTYATTSGFAGVDLKSSFGPVSGGASYPVGTTFATSLGSFAFTQTGGGVSTVSGSVPEPSSIALCLVAGAVGLARSVRRRFQDR